MSYQTYPYQQQPSAGGGGGYYVQPPHDPFRAYYADRLRQLTFNSRPIIQDLSMMAGAQRDQNNWDGMNAIVQEIEEATLRALPTQKLPLLYLIDSISKNIGAPYTTHLLPPIIPRLYLRTYREVDGVTKAKMEEMINLWRTGGPNRTELYGSGVREQIERDIFGTSYNHTNGMNMNGLPNLPSLPTVQQVKNAVQGALDKKQREAASKAWDMATGQQVNALTGILNLLNSTNVPPQELAQIMDQVKSMNGQPQSQPPQPQPQPQQVFTPMNQPVTPNWGVPPPQQAIPPFPPHSSRIPPPPAAGRPPFVPRPTPTPPQASLNTPLHMAGSTTPIPISNPVVPLPVQLPTMANLPIDVSKILNSLNQSGVVGQSKTPEPQAQPSTPTLSQGVQQKQQQQQKQQKSSLEEYEDMIIGLGVSLRSIDLNAPHILSLEHLPQRCKQCGMRFASDDNAKFQSHMDWHFRRNRKERESAGRGSRRRWLPRAEEWINDTYSSSSAEAGPSTNPMLNSPGKSASTTMTISAERLQQLREKWIKVPSSNAKANSVCPVCKESFVKEWSQDEEEWIWKNALNINGTIYHATCRAEQLSAMRRLKGSDPNKRSTSGSPRLTPQPSEQVKAETTNTTTSSPQMNVKRKAEEEGEAGGQKGDDEKMNDAVGSENKRIKVEQEQEQTTGSVAQSQPNRLGDNVTPVTVLSDIPKVQVKEVEVGVKVEQEEEKEKMDDQLASNLENSGIV
ncbi:hypothetical protein I203_104109 [Kwoniella mangroviensis CBS 8507]|uniref:uncharacterized protein n=1 Tax=Kwoniella mangroviensis CBS 8507 TaxID=1296122 RepID=UPI00080D805B|nr:uncharacterized protein I203_06415 [Kwoniella mangroviensis CBS 8507]OCF64680.1 hypothetical protein I203_06415 [Kwoniella mangroviensis CBS 8507]